MRSVIERRGHDFVSIDAGSAEANAVTRFTPVDKASGFSVWKAYPSTGKPHQIRLHAEKLGIPVLGDSAHGGAPFPRLMLHSHELTFDDAGTTVSHLSPPPLLFREPGRCKDRTLSRWHAALDRRSMLFAAGPEDCVRLLHREDPNLRCDRFGEVLWFYWYGDTPPRDPELDRIRSFATEAGARHWCLALMSDRGDPNSERGLITSGGPPTWTAVENGLRYLFSSGRGRSPGLFLDQRENRLTVRRTAEGKRVLNLFCYTGGFSIAAAAGGANEIVSVDTSKTALEWAQENVALNDLGGVTMRFIREDARTYLKRLARRGEQFDVVVCDPPSFARGKGAVFSLEKELDSLLEAACAVTAPAGRLLFATNHERIPLGKLVERMRDVGKGSGFGLVTPAPAGPDFEIPGEEPLMKAGWLSMHD